jgi:RND family efflux transporter MFP subunit
MIQNAINNTQAQALFEIQEISQIRLSIPLPETNAPDVKKGMNVTVTFPELPGQTFAAKVSRTSNALDYKSKTMRVEIDLPNRSRTIKPGMYAKAFMQLNIKEEVLSLPVTAQVIKAKKPYLLLVDNANKVQQIALQKGLHDKDYFEVLNTDITKDSKIIIKGKGLVKPAQIVNPVMN